MDKITELEERMGRLEYKLDHFLTMQKFVDYDKCDHQWVEEFVPSVGATNAPQRKMRCKKCLLVTYIND